MVKPITTYVAQKRLSWYGHVMRREDTNVAKQVTTMKVGGKIPGGRPRLRWMDRVRSGLTETTPARPKADTEPRRMEKGNHGDRPRTRIRSVKVRIKAEYFLFHIVHVTQLFFYDMYTTHFVKVRHISQ